MRNFNNIVRALCVVLAMVFMASSAKAASSEVDIEALQCPLLGGTTIPQPAGSTITACCYDDGCYICDANGSNCEFDPAYKGTEGEAANFTGLYLYYSSQRGDNFSTGTAKGIKAAKDAGYRLVRKQGCVLTKQLPGTIPLDLYWHAGRGDNFTTATGAGDAQAANYKFVRTITLRRQHQRAIQMLALQNINLFGLKDISVTRHYVTDLPFRNSGMVCTTDLNATGHDMTPNKPRQKWWGLSY